MRYEEPVYRPPCEADSLIIQATIGCPHNRCTFCGMYKTKEYRVRPLEEVKEDLERARATYGRVPSLFFADGNTIAMRSSDLGELIRFARGLFPELERVSCYGGTRFIRGRKVEDLRRLQEAGLDIIYLGLESGDDEVLSRVKKGVTADDVVRAARKVKEAGIDLSVYVLAGLGGKELSREHALNTARALDRMEPHYIRMRTLVVLPGTPLYEEMTRGEFEELDGEGIVQETRLLIENLGVEGAWVLSDTISNYLPLYGRRPDQKEQMLAAIDELLSQPDSPYLKPRVITSL